MTTLLAWIPFIHPMNALQDWWYLLVIPLALGISVIYKAMRMPRLDEFWRQTTVMTLQIIIAMIALAVCLTLLVQVILPLLPVE